MKVHCTVVVLRTTVVEILSTESIIHDPHSALEKATNRVELGVRSESYEAFS